MVSNLLNVRPLPRGIVNNDFMSYGIACPCFLGRGARQHVFSIFFNFPQSIYSMNAAEHKHEQEMHETVIKRPNKRS